MTGRRFFVSFFSADQLACDDNQIDGNQEQSSYITYSDNFYFTYCDLAPSYDVATVGQFRPWSHCEVREDSRAGSRKRSSNDGTPPGNKLDKQHDQRDD